MRHLPFSVSSGKRPHRVSPRGRFDLASVSGHRIHPALWLGRDPGSAVVPSSTYRPFPEITSPWPLLCHAGWHSTWWGNMTQGKGWLRRAFLNLMSSLPYENTGLVSKLQTKQEKITTVSAAWPSVALEAQGPSSTAFLGLTCNCQAAGKYFQKWHTGPLSTIWKAPRRKGRIISMKR